MLTLARLGTAAAVVGLALAPAAYGWARTTPQAELQREIAGRTAGAPVDCIPISRIDSTRIIDRTAIIFDTVGRTLYVNTPPNGASQLDSGEALVIDTHTPELCSIDIVRLHEFGQRGFAGFVGLGKFVPYTKQG